MALQSQGTPENPVPISFSQIEAEFGDGGSSRNIGKYRVSTTVGGMINLPLDDGIPQGDSSIAFSDFYGKQLNIIVSFDKNENRPDKGKSKYDNDNEITVVGGFRNKPNSSSGSKVILHVHPNKTIGSSNDSQNHCALRTGGGWESNPQSTELEINIGSGALVSGAGGDGGKGGKPGSKKGDDNAAKGLDGEDGSSAIGIQYPVDKITIESGATVQAGGGGGGGGGGAAGEMEESVEKVGGGGGGGGQGVPAGSGGEALVKKHEGNYRVEIQPQDGQNGSATGGGNGGDGGVNNEGEEEASAQSGGGGGGGGTTPGVGGEDYRSIGGSNGESATDGGSGTEEGEGGTGGDGDAEGSGQQQGPGGSPGESGFAITNSTGQGSVTIVNNGGTISGATNGTKVS